MSGRRPWRRVLVPAVITLGGLALAADGWLERQTAWVHASSLSSDAAAETFRLAQRSPRVARAHEAEQRAAVDTMKMAESAGERRMLAGAALALVGLALGAWLRRRGSTSST